MNNIITSIMLQMLPLGICAAFVTYITINLTVKRRFLAVILALTALLVTMIFPIKFGRKTCSNCNTKLSILDSKCNICGEHQDTWKLLGKIECPYCDNVIDAESDQCNYCGSKLNN